MLKRIEYCTINSRNRETAPAYNMKVYNLGFKKDIESKIYDLMNLPGWYDEINLLIDDFNTSNGGYSAGFAGRSGGYLVLYQPKTNAGFEAKDTPVEIVDRFGAKRFVDIEHLNNNKTKFARLLYKYRGKWYFKQMKGVCMLLINKENIKQVLI